VPTSPQGWLTPPFRIPRDVRHWLSDRGSLTRRLRSSCASFRVQPVATGLARPNRDELGVLRLRAGARAYVREVQLICDGTAVVFAHSVLPVASLRGGWNGVTRLGTRPLGDALFNNPRIRRRPLQYCCLGPRHPLHRGVQRHLLVGGARLWARRSLFCLRGHPLLVTEVFLPAIQTL
jgi:chorismate--pyruvate lyase